MTVTSSEPIGIETVSIRFEVMPILWASSMIFARPAFAAFASWVMPIALPRAMEILIGIVLIDLATASHIGTRPA